MLAEDNVSNTDIYKEILIQCPKCKNKKRLNIPGKIINESKQLTTISIPSGLNCEHSFQAFIDKNYKIRGYQSVDFDFSKLEFYESNFNETEENQTDLDCNENFASLPLFQDIIEALRNFVDDREVLGCALLRVDGKVLYSSLSHGTLINMIKEFEVRNKKKLITVKKMLLELENDEKVCAKYISIHDSRFILVLIVAPKVKLGMGNVFLRDLARKIENLNKN